MTIVVLAEMEEAASVLNSWEFQLEGVDGTLLKLSYKSGQLQCFRSVADHFQQLVIHFLRFVW